MKINRLASDLKVGDIVEGVHEHYLAKIANIVPIDNGRILITFSITQLYFQNSQYDYSRVMINFYASDYITLHLQQS